MKRILKRKNSNKQQLTIFIKKPLFVFRRTAPVGIGLSAGAVFMGNDLKQNQA